MQKDQLVDEEGADDLGRIPPRSRPMPVDVDMLKALFAEQ